MGTWVGGFKELTGISLLPFLPYPTSGGTITVLCKKTSIDNERCEKLMLCLSISEEQSKKRTLPTFPPTFMPSVMEYNAGGGFGAACAENRPFGLSTNSRFRSLPGGSPTLNSYGYSKPRT